jgi:23S rRNA (cytidine1920-2'-O)/16S rRNA (cytidine1409-2'-O)-methyltransferase
VKERERLDKLVAARPEVPSRERARSLIMAGRVRVDGVVIDKPGAEVRCAAHLDVAVDSDAFASRGGDKLEGALRAFGTTVSGRVVLDVGASTGGFTDCVLRHGARRVIAVDVGYGQFDWRLRQDERVVLLERTNARHLQLADLPEAPELAVIDVSFISLRLILPAVAALLATPGDIVALVKPQFEVGRGQVGKGGVVRSPELQVAAVTAVRECGAGLGLICVGQCDSPLLGPKGNREFFLAFAKRD